MRSLLALACLLAFATSAHAQSLRTLGGHLMTVGGHLATTTASGGGGGGGGGTTYSVVAQNATGSTQPARYLTWNQAWLQGDMPASAHLVGAQLDAKNFWPDGSVKLGIVTVNQDAPLAASATRAFTLTNGTGPTGSNVSLTGATFNTQIDITPSGGSLIHTDVDAAIAAANTAGTLSYWQQGPYATQARVDVPITGSLHLKLDCTAFADGNTQLDVVVSNDLAMLSNGDDITYSSTITRNGTVVDTETNLKHWQYMDWNKRIGEPQINIQHDIATLEATGWIPHFDLTTGVSSAYIATFLNDVTTNPTHYQPLGNGPVLTDMGAVSGRADIGPFTDWDTMCLMMQTADTCGYAMRAADLDGSIPWHMFDSAHGHYIQLSERPNIWFDVRAGQDPDTTALTQQVKPDFGKDDPGDGWGLDGAHQPETGYAMYLLTGNRYYLDNHLAQASWAMASVTPSARQYGVGMVTNIDGQLRSAAWGLRAMLLSSAIVPDGDQAKSYYAAMTTTNIANLHAILSGETGELQGIVINGPGAPQSSCPNPCSGDATTPPWQQEYMSHVLAMGTNLGFPGFSTVLAQTIPFISGRFTQDPATGLDPYSGAAVELVVYVGNANTTLQPSWHAVQTLSDNDGWTSPGVWAEQSYKQYQWEAYGSIGGMLHAFPEDATSVAARAWLTAHWQVDLDFKQTNPRFNIVP